MKALNSGSTLQRKFLPSSTPIPNWVIDDVMSDMSETVLRVFLYLFRKTVGWNNHTEEISLNRIMHDCNLKNRNSVVHAVKILCDCWYFWKKTRGKKGQGSSIFTIAGISDSDVANARIILTDEIYGTSLPTQQQAKDKPPTELLYQSALKSLSAKYGADWWVAKASADWYPYDTSGGISGIPEIPVEVSQ
jgi:hypothetical protein